MTVAALYDIHGNAPALEAVLEAIQKEGVDRIVVGGDVLPGPLPIECLEALFALSIPVDFIHGNGDREVLAALDGTPSSTLPPHVRAAIEWTGAQLSADHRARLNDWPSQLSIDDVGAGSVLFCHATPRNDTEIFTERTPAEVLTPIFGQLPQDIVVCGHTHMQFERVIGATRVVNAGSVGMPFGDPGAYWLKLGETVGFRCTPYDRDAAADRIKASGYPDADGFAENNVRTAPAREAMLAAFAHASIGSGTRPSS